MYAVQPHIDPADRIQPDTGVAHACKVQVLTGQRERQKKRPAGGPFMDVMSNSDSLCTEYRVLQHNKKKEYGIVILHSNSRLVFFGNSRRGKEYRKKRIIVNKILRRRAP